MAGCNEKSIEIGGTDDRQMVRSVRAETGPGFFDACGGEGRNEFDGGAEIGVNAGRGDGFVVAGVLDRGASENAAIVARNEIYAFRPQDALDFHAFVAEGKHLTLRGTNGGRLLDTGDLRRKTSGGDDDVAPSDLLAVGKQETATLR